MSAMLYSLLILLGGRGKMAYVCEICGKKPVSGNKRSHSNIKTKTRWIPNLQNIRIIINGTVKHAKVCTACIRSGKIRKAPSRKGLVKAPSA